MLSFQFKLFDSECLLITFLVHSAPSGEEAGHEWSAGQGQTGGDEDRLCGSNMQDLSPQQTGPHHQQTQVARPLNWRLPYLHTHTHGWKSEKPLYGSNLLKAGLYT